ncbi:hypothetical protein PQJ75_01390 [Rhodoplanes sp. TEM]|uniref:Uncharacterized protein n=1 Tax=Rhodoplanes tepidamans TaxID=200616 RepID=A0ABT5J9A7_RHOTP|nr:MULTISPECIES: hypothetical protein [Rhodoplanes]MDC7786256.1 hypothetical protein [Rhodoplanes tepidamans]MDC7982373.1 hypothetical protein [Rhodoplanes sp. TEM]MDQ0355055.1 hypothetical protein [Rhodoplanes tepidamans]
MSQELDVNDMFARASITIAPEETAEERTVRLGKDDREHRIEHVKGMIVFGLIVLALVLIGGLCAYEAVFDAAASADTRRWAQTTLSALFAGSVSFVLGQMTAKRK